MIANIGLNLALVSNAILRSGRFRCSCISRFSLATLQGRCSSSIHQNDLTYHTSRHYCSCSSNIVDVACLRAYINEINRRGFMTPHIIKAAFLLFNTPPEDLSYNKSTGDSGTSNNVSDNDSKTRHFSFHPECSEHTRTEIISSYQVIPDFISPEEEQFIIAEVDPHFQRLPYEFNHWDDAIVGFRETEVSRWSSNCAPILERLKTRAFSTKKKILIFTHILDLAENGHIKPHVDSIRFSGNTIAGLSLNSAAVMRLVSESDTNQVVDILLPPRSLYIMKDRSRYNYTHEVLANEYSKFGDMPVPKTRRISIICRNEPL